MRLTTQLLPPPRTGRHRHPVLLLLAVLVMLAAACSSSSGDADTSAADTAEAPDAGGDGQSAVGLSGEGEEALMTDEAAGDDAPAEDTADGATGEDGSTVPPSSPTAATGERIIKEGTVTIQVEPGDYDTAFGQVVSRAQALGGHVSGTSSSTTPDPDVDDGRLTSGQVTIRIPVRAFEDLLLSIGDAGTITDRSITSQDVTAEYTDLESRRRNLQAQERFYLGLLDDAQTVADAIAVQQQLDDVQAQIEQITGRLNLLQDRSAFSTLTVRIIERGATADALDQSEPGGLAPYIDDAVNTLIATVGSLIVFATFLSPFVVLGALGFLVWRGVRRRRPDRTAAAPVQSPTTSDSDTGAPAGQPQPSPATVGAGAPAGAGDPAGSTDHG